MTTRLYRYLRQLSSAGGLVMARESRLIEELSTSREALVHALDTLEKQGTIRVLSPAPYLTVKVGSWPSSSTDRERRPQPNSSLSAPLHIEVPVSSEAAAAATDTEDGGAGEG